MINTSALKLMDSGLFVPLCAFSDSRRRAEQNRAAQYFLGSQDQVLMAVNIWGFVNKPGQYMVPYDTDLISLLSYAGGPREEAKIKSIKVVRPAKSANQGPDQVITVDVKKFLESGKAAEIPVLKPGDTVVVSEQITLSANSSSCRQDRRSDSGLGWSNIIIKIVKPFPFY